MEKELGPGQEACVIKQSWIGCGLAHSDFSSGLARWLQRSPDQFLLNAQDVHLSDLWSFKGAIWLPQDDRSCSGWGRPILGAMPASNGAWKSQGSTEGFQALQQNTAHLASVLRGRMGEAETKRTHGTVFR